MTEQDKRRKDGSGEGPVPKRGQTAPMEASTSRIETTNQDSWDSAYQDFFDNAPDMFFSVDGATGTIIRYNRALKMATGYPDDELLGLPIYDLYHPDCREETARIGRLFLETGEVTDAELQLKTRDGGRLDVSLNISAVYDEQGTIIRSRAVLRDITERKQAERRLHERTAELESFSYAVSHDLRAPLRGIDGFSGLLLQDHTDQLDEEGQRLLNAIRRNAQKMGRLIDDLLSFHRLGRRPVEPSEIDMETLAREVFDELRPWRREGSLQVNIESLPAARADVAMIRQVFVNLISNAIKFTKNREKALIRIGSRVKDEKENIYFVQDNGVGFDMKYAHKVFEVFQRLHTEEEFEGSGIGLALVHRMVGRHGGKVWAEGKLNHGATIFFTLPRG